MFPLYKSFTNIRPSLVLTRMKSLLRDEELINQFLTTSPNECFETLYSRYVNKVYKRCLSLTKDSDQAHDFTQDIFLRAFSRLDRFEQRSAFSTWLYSISYNYCMDQLQIAKRKQTVSLADNNDYGISESDDSVRYESRMQHLAKILDSMPPEEVQLLRLKYEDGVDIDTIARQYNISHSAVKMRLKRSRDKIRLLCNPDLM